MMSVVAWLPEFPPELMMRGMKRESTTARAISCSNRPMAVAVSISPEEEGAEPARPLPQHAAEGNLGVGDVEGLDTTQLLHVLGLLLDQGVDHVVHRDDAEQAAGAIDHRDGEQVVLPDEPGHLFAVGVAGRRSTRFPARLAFVTGCSGSAIRSSRNDTTPARRPVSGSTR